MLKHYLTRQKAACYLSERGLPVSKNTLQKFATTGGGPSCLLHLWKQVALHHRGIGLLGRGAAVSGAQIHK